MQVDNTKPMKRGTKFSDFEREQMGKRLTELAARANVTKADIARYCEVTRRMPGNWMNGTSVPKEPHLSALADYLSTSRQYILYGDKSTQLSQNVKAVERTNSGDGITALTVFKSLPKALQNVNGGDLSEEDNAEFLPVSTEWLAGHGIAESSVVAYRVPDEIQNPPLMPGSTALIDTADKTPVDGNIYAVDQAGLIRLWQVFNVPGGYRLVSPNRDYPDETCSTDDAVIAGCVVRSYSPSLRR